MEQISVLSFHILMPMTLRKKFKKEICAGGATKHISEKKASF